MGKEEIDKQEDVADVQAMSRHKGLFLGLLPGIILLGYPFIALPIKATIDKASFEILWGIFLFLSIGIAVISPFYLCAGAIRWIKENNSNRSPVAIAAFLFFINVSCVLGVYGGLFIYAMSQI